MKKAAICLSFLGYLNCLWAQQFNYTSKIDSVSQTGYYKIQLSPEIVSVTKTDYSDIRIYDSKHNEIPYVLKLEHPVTEQTGFKEFKVIENKYLPKQAISRIIVDNSEKNTISVFNLVVRNTAAEKEITLKGSDDQKNWYFIKKTFLSVMPTIDNETTKVMVFDFPKSNYRFFELTLNDKKKDPLQVIQVGYYDYEVAKGLYSEISGLTFRQTDSIKIKKSYISIKFTHPYEIDKLELQFNEPELYLRDCSVGIYTTVNKKVVFNEIGKFMISSKSKPIWRFSDIKTDGLTIVINNSDNVPLQLVSIKVFQLNKYLVAKLKSGETYHLFAGQQTLNAPEYDLKYFADSLPSKITIVKCDGLIDIAKHSNTKHASFFNNTFMWIAIVLVILLLAWFSIKLVREMGKETN